MFAEGRMEVLIKTWNGCCDPWGEYLLVTMLLPLKNLIIVLTGCSRQLLKASENFGRLNTNLLSEIAEGVGKLLLM